jgi:hypothetical protein
MYRAATALLLLAFCQSHPSRDELGRWSAIPNSSKRLVLGVPGTHELRESTVVWRQQERVFQEISEHLVSPSPADGDHAFDLASFENFEVHYWIARIVSEKDPLLQAALVFLCANCMKQPLFPISGNPESLGLRARIACAFTQVIDWDSVNSDTFMGHLILSRTFKILCLGREPQYPRAGLSPEPNWDPPVRSIADSNVLRRILDGIVFSSRDFEYFGQIGISMDSAGIESQLSLLSDVMRMLAVGIARGHWCRPANALDLICGSELPDIEVCDFVSWYGSEYSLLSPSDLMRNLRSRPGGGVAAQITRQIGLRGAPTLVWNILENSEIRNRSDINEIIVAAVESLTSSSSETTVLRVERFLENALKYPASDAFAVGALEALPLIYKHDPRLSCALWQSATESENPSIAYAALRGLNHFRTDPFPRAVLSGVREGRRDSVAGKILHDADIGSLKILYRIVLQDDSESASSNALEEVMVLLKTESAAATNVINAALNSRFETVRRRGREMAVAAEEDERGQKSAAEDSDP